MIDFEGVEYQFNHEDGTLIDVIECEVMGVYDEDGHEVEWEDEETEALHKKNVAALVQSCLEWL